MIPLLEPAILFEPLAVALAWLGVVAAAGAVVVVGLVARAGRPARRPRGVVAPLPRRMPRAA